MGRLTTHVLDTAQGCPAAGMEIELWQLAADGSRTLLRAVHTDVDGRTADPLLADHEMAVGAYELIFGVGAYFASQAVTTSAPPFLGPVPIRFSIADPAAHYHVPLLTSPWAYSTYRGS